jgi:hypothetical protein
MSALLKTLTEKVKTAEMSAKQKEALAQKEREAKYKNDVKKGIEWAKSKIPQIEKDMIAAAEKGEKSLRVYTSQYADDYSLSTHEKSEQDTLIKHFQDQKLSVKPGTYKSPSGGSDCFYGGKDNYEHYIVISWE